MKEKKKVRIEMSVEFDVLTSDRPYSENAEWLSMIAKNYVSALGDKSIKIEKVDFV